MDHEYFFKIKSSPLCFTSAYLFPLLLSFLPCPPPSLPRDLRVSVPHDYSTSGPRALGPSPQQVLLISSSVMTIDPLIIALRVYHAPPSQRFDQILP